MKFHMLYWLVMLDLLGLVMCIPVDGFNLMNTAIGIAMLIVGTTFLIIVWKSPVNKAGSEPTYKVYHKLQSPTNLHVSEEKKQKEINHRQEINSFDRKFSKD